MLRASTNFEESGNYYGSLITDTRLQNQLWQAAKSRKKIIVGYVNTDTLKLYQGYEEKHGILAPVGS